MWESFVFDITIRYSSIMSCMSCLLFSLLFLVFDSVWQIKLATHQLLDARKYSFLYRIILQWTGRMFDCWSECYCVGQVFHAILPVSSRSIICYQTTEIMASYGRGVLYLPHWLPAPDHPNGDEHHNHMLQSCSNTDWGLYHFYRCTKLPMLQNVVSATPVQPPQRVFSLIHMTSLILMHSKTAHKECAFWSCLHWLLCTTPGRCIKWRTRCKFLINLLAKLCLLLPCFCSSWNAVKIT